MSYLDLYNQIKSLESVFPLPIDYVTVNVGTFDASTGVFQGLTTSIEKDPEPIEHGPGQHPVNPKPRFIGESWVSITIDASWHETITTVAAPKVGLAPVLLKFSIVNNNGGAWSVEVQGRVVPVGPGQSSVTVNIWDTTAAPWSIFSGNVSYTDRLMIQRAPNQIVGAGAFTIPALPLSIVYAPPADAAKLSKASYQESASIGTTSSFQWTNDSNTSSPWFMSQTLSGLKDLQSILNGLSAVFSHGNATDKEIGQTFDQISKGIGTISGTETIGTVSQDGFSLTITESKTQTIFAETKAGGPGAGDAIHYLRDAKFIWLMSGGQFRIALMGGIYVSLSASYLAANANNQQATGLPPEVVQQLLAINPFVAGGSMVQLPSGRFEDIDSQVQGPFEYGGGQTLTGSYTKTFTTTETRSHSDYTVHSQDFNAGWLAQLFGQGSAGLKTTLTFTQAAGTTTTSTQSINWELHSGLSERFVVEVWRDRLFGTFAFRQEPVSSSARLQGVAKGPDGKPLIKQSAKLTAGGRTYFTVTDEAGHYAFFARNIPAGQASLSIGNQPQNTVLVATL
jgi:hypothetical protein